MLLIPYLSLESQLGKTSTNFSSILKTLIMAYKKKIEFKTLYSYLSWKIKHLQARKCIAFTVQYCTIYYRHTHTYIPTYTHTLVHIMTSCVVKTIETSPEKTLRAF